MCKVNLTKTDRCPCVTHMKVSLTSCGKSILHKTSWQFFTRSSQHVVISMRCWQWGMSVCNYEHCCVLRHPQKCAELSSGWQLLYGSDRQILGPRIGKENVSVVLFMSTGEEISLLSESEQHWDHISHGWGCKCSAKCLEKQQQLNSISLEMNSTCGDVWEISAKEDHSLRKRGRQTPGSPTVLVSRVTWERP